MATIPMNTWRALPRFAILLGTAALLLMIPAACQAFSVLAHQAVVDQAWDTTLLPLVRKRFPNATQQELDQSKVAALYGHVQCGVASQVAMVDITQWLQL